MNARALLDAVLPEEDAKYPLAGKTVDGRSVRMPVPNTESIASSLDDYTVLPGIREVPLSLFGDRIRDVRAWVHSYAEKLAAQIEESGELSPLIVVDDGHADGPYILEGANRLNALFVLRARSFPALVVLEEPAEA